MLRSQSHHLAPAVSSCCCSSSNPSSSRRPCNARFVFSASNSTNAPGTSPAPSLSLCLDRLPNRRQQRRRRPCRGKSDAVPLSCCRASLGGGSSSGSSYRSPDWREQEDDDQFLQASFLESETVRHYSLRKQGFLEETKWHSSSQTFPLYIKSKGSKSDISSIGHGFLRRFQSPTIFLKVACDGDLLLPIVVGEVAIEKLIDTLRDDQEEGCPDQFQFAKNLVGTLGYEVKMVRITKRVVNTYYARIFLGKPAERASMSVDSRPSDAINVAIKCKAPIYVSKDIVAKDAIKIVYGTWRGKNAKTVYDVSLDSATEGPDLLSEELDLVRKMSISVMEERYKDAAIWRDKLNKLRMPRHEH